MRRVTRTNQCPVYLNRDLRLKTMAEAAKNIPVDARDQSGTGGHARALRRAGKIPRIVYGGGNTPEGIAIDPTTV